MAKSLKLYTKPRKKRIGPEAQLQMAVVQYLKLAGVPGLLYFAVANEQKCSVQRGAMLKRMGRLAGVSDLVILIPQGRGIGLPVPLFLELKAKGGRATDDQLLFAEAVRGAGGVCALADNIDAAIKVLTEYGAIKPVSRRASPFAKAA